MAVDYGYRWINFNKDYRPKYAVLIFLPSHLDLLVKDLRERFDPDYNLIASHITLVFPFETLTPLDEIMSAVHRAIATIKPFKIELSSIDDFYPELPIIYWKVKENLYLNELHKNLYTSLELVLPSKKIIPHVTVAKEISYHRVIFVKEQIVSYLPDENFVVETIELVTPLVSQNWVSVKTFHLSK